VTGRLELANAASRHHQPGGWAAGEPQCAVDDGFRYVFDGLGREGAGRQDRHPDTRPPGWSRSAHFHHTRREASKHGAEHAAF